MDTAKTIKTLEKMLFIMSWIQKYEYWIKENEAHIKDRILSKHHLKIENVKFERKIMILKSVYFKLNLTL